LAQEIVVHNEAVRHCCTQMLHLYLKLLRAGANAPEMRIAADLPAVIDDNIAAQRRESQNVLLFMRERLSAWPALFLWGAAINGALASIVLAKPTPTALVLVCFLIGLGCATRVPAVAAPDSEIGSAAAAPLLRKCVRGYVWSASCFLVSIALCGHRSHRQTLRLALVHASGSVAVERRYPLVFYVACLY
jgi:hypothetical protein